jgi:predicted PurR-regulated permease PerM
MTHAAMRRPVRNEQPDQQPELHRLQIDASHAQIIIAVGVLVAIAYVAKAPLVVLIVSVLVAFVLEPLVGQLERIRVPRSAAALIAVLLLLAAIGVTTLASYQKITELINELPKYTNEIRSYLVKFRRQAEQIQSTTQDILGQGQPASRPLTIVQQTSPTETITTGLGTLSDFFMSATFVPFLAYFMLTWKEHVRKSTLLLFEPSNRKTAYVTLGEISDMIKRFLAGSVLIALLLGVMGGLIFRAIGLPYYFIVGVVSGALSLVPYFGVLLATAPPLIVGMGHLNGGNVAVILATVAGLHVVAVQVLFPKLLGRRLSLNPLAVTLSLLFWASLWGAWGLVLALPITAMMKIVLDHVERLKPYADWMGE